MKSDTLRNPFSKCTNSLSISLVEGMRFVSLTFSRPNIVVRLEVKVGKFKEEC